MQALCILNTVLSPPPATLLQVIIFSPERWWCFFWLHSFNYTIYVPHGNRLIFEKVRQIMWFSCLKLFKRFSIPCRVKSKFLILSFPKGLCGSPLFTPLLSFPHTLLYTHSSQTKACSVCRTHHLCTLCSAASPLPQYHGLPHLSIILSQDGGSSTTSPSERSTM